MTRIASQDKGSVPAALADWLRSGVGLVGDLTSCRIAGGLSNVTSVVTDADGRRVVVRRPPDGQHGGGAHDVLREARIQQALGAAVPVPVVLATCADEHVLGVPFYVMDHAEGEVVATAEVARRIPAGSRPELGTALVDVLVDLQAVDLDAVGLADLRRATPYPQRLLRRWGAQWRATARRAVPAVDHVTRRLEEIVPQLAVPSDRLVHGDFRFGNVMVDVSADGDARISALLDWELATTGHPLADLGFLGARLQAPSGVLDGPEPAAVEGFPTFAELVGHFERRTGLSTADLPVLVALNAWRWAIIVEGVRERLVAGTVDDVRQDAAWHRRRVDLLAEYAADLLA